MGDITKATRESLTAADHLTDMDKGAVETLLAIAIALDLRDAEWETLKTIALEAGSKPPREDFALYQTYLRYAESLGLTPAGRAALDRKAKHDGEDKRSATLTALRSRRGTA